MNLTPEQKARLAIAAALEAAGWILQNRDASGHGFAVFPANNTA